MKEIYWIIIKGIIALILVVPTYRKAVRDRDTRNKNSRFKYK